MIFFLVIALFICGIFQAWNGEWTTALELWALGWIVVQVTNAHVEATVARRNSQKILTVLAEFHKKLFKGNRNGF